jgi:hypothetical protein
VTTGTEVQLYERVARYLNTRYPQMLYHFDLAGVNNPSLYTRNLYGRLNKPGWPDLHIPAQRTYGDATFRGLFVELKREGVRLYKRNGDWSSSHIRQQATGHTAAAGCWIRGAVCSRL